MTPIPPPHPACANLLQIAASIARGNALPRQGRMSAFERQRLEASHRDFASEIVKASDALRDRIRELEHQLATAGQAVGSTES